MQCVVQNKTQFLIVHDSPAYIDSGGFDEPPQNVDAYSNTVFTVCTGEVSTAVAGGIAFRIILDAAMEYPFALVRAPFACCARSLTRFDTLGLDSASGWGVCRRCRGVCQR